MLKNIGKGKTIVVYSINIVDPSNWLLVSIITFIRYADSQNIWKPNNLDIDGSR